MENVKDLAQFFKALGDETRLRLIYLLAKQAPERARCVGSLARALDTTASNVSQHLKVLKDLGLIVPSRHGYRIHYFLDQTQMAKYDLLRVELLGGTFTGQTNLEELEGTTMCCNQDKDCKHPDRKPNHEDCTPEQIEECHGEDVVHHCCEKQKD